LPPSSVTPVPTTASVAALTIVIVERGSTLPVESNEGQDGKKKYSPALLTSCFRLPDLRFSP
jgi:hypothetical protein